MHGRWTQVAIPTVALGSFLAALWTGTYVLKTYSNDIRLTTSLLVLSGLVVLLLGAFLIARELLHWRNSVRALAKLTNELRAGDAPLAELDRIVGGAAVLIEPVRSILLDLREAKRANVSLQEEMRSRILSRTDALERQLGSLKTQASRDALTGLHNRRAFEQMLPQVFNACRTGREDLCAMMIDVDNFKPLNDTLGHAAGDDLLKAIGEIIRSSVREHDVAFRPGGDEFAILLPRANTATGRKLAERLASLVEHLVRPMRLPHPPGLSIGVASLSDDPRVTDMKSLMDLADRRLYEVKQSKPHRKPRNVA